MQWAWEGEARENATPHFWGADDGEAVLGQLSDVADVVDRGGFYCGDGLVTFGRNLSFLDDEEFRQAFQTVIHRSNYVGYGILWRLHVYCWSARTASRLRGAVVECGVAAGISSRVLCEYLDLLKGQNATMPEIVLYDTWDSLSPNSEAFTATGESFESVRSQFEAFPSVRLVQGWLPDSLHVYSPEEITFLHLDLNNAESERAVVSHLYDRVVTGGIILVDDFGFSGFRATNANLRDWARDVGQSILELPTGQGMLIKT